MIGEGGRVGPWIVYKLKLELRQRLRTAALLISISVVAETTA